MQFEYIQICDKNDFNILRLYRFDCYTIKSVFVHFFYWMQVTLPGYTIKFSVFLFCIFRVGCVWMCNLWLWMVNENVSTESASNTVLILHIEFCELLPWSLNIFNRLWCVENTAFMAKFNFFWKISLFRLEWSICRRRITTKYKPNGLHSISKITYATTTKRWLG